MTEKSNPDDWRYGLCALDSMPSNVNIHINFIKLWQSKFNGARLPKRRDFMFEDFAGLHGWVTIDEVHYDPFDLKCTLYGSKLSDIEEREETGMKLSSYLDDPIEGEHFRLYLETHEQAALQHKIAHTAGSQIHKGRPIGTEWVGLPCADDGVNVSHFISLVWRCTMDELEALTIGSNA